MANSYIPEPHYSRIIELLDALAHELNEVPQSDKDRRAGSYSFTGQISWRIGNLRRTIERGTLS